MQITLFLIGKVCSCVTNWEVVFIIFVKNQLAFLIQHIKKKWQSTEIIVFFPHIIIICYYMNCHVILFIHDMYISHKINPTIIIFSIYITAITWLPYQPVKIFFAIVVNGELIEPC